MNHMIFNIWYPIFSSSSSSAAAAQHVIRLLSHTENGKKSACVYIINLTGDLPEQVDTWQGTNVGRNTKTTAILHIQKISCNHMRGYDTNHNY